MNKVVYIVIGCDTDPDRVGFLDNVSTDTLDWRGMLEGIPETKEKVDQLKDDFNGNPKFTWCLRADHQIKETYGSYNAILDKNKSFFEDLEKSGDELGWHPHFFKFDSNSDKWYQEFNAVDWQTDMLKNAFKEFQEILPDRAKSVRMGWDYHNNDTFHTLQELGVEVDFSGIPRLYINPKNKDLKSVNFFDWSLTPNEPYFPSALDYRRPPVKDEETLKLLESPNFVSHSFLWSLMSGLFFAKKMKDPSQIFRAIRRPVYWIGITGKTKLFSPLVDQVAKDLQHREKIIFVTYFHPDELLQNKSSLYSLKFMIDNLSLLKAKVNSNNAQVKFIRASDIKDVLGWS